MQSQKTPSPASFESSIHRRTCLLGDLLALDFLFRPEVSLLGITADADQGVARIERKECCDHKQEFHAPDVTTRPDFGKDKLKRS